MASWSPDTTRVLASAGAGGASSVRMLSPIWVFAASAPESAVCAAARLESELPVIEFRLSRAAFIPLSAWIPNSLQAMLLTARAGWGAAEAWNTHTRETSVKTTRAIILQDVGCSKVKKGRKKVCGRRKWRKCTRQEKEGCVKPTCPRHFIPLEMLI
ncbi:hypothetical protein DFH06DRAFT_1209455 [Mycena polygramma]|nr:hypothetical protein DFH06DRAFT_1209455 [Mycena polygramma]